RHSVTPLQMSLSDWLTLRLPPVSVSLLSLRVCFGRDSVLCLKGALVVVKSSNMFWGGLLIYFIKLFCSHMSVYMFLPKHAGLLLVQHIKYIVPRTSPPTAQAWTPTQSPEKKMSRVLESPGQVVCQEEPRRPLTSLVSRMYIKLFCRICSILNSVKFDFELYVCLSIGRGTGRRHRILKWPFSPVTFRSHKLVLPAEVPEKKVCCFCPTLYLILSVH
ncbi:hypothetical protein GOODEAATRI_033691, partial [Goodea atripinnis]